MLFIIFQISQVALNHWANVGKLLENYWHTLVHSNNCPPFCTTVQRTIRQQTGPDYHRAIWVLRSGSTGLGGSKNVFCLLSEDTN